MHNIPVLDLDLVNKASPNSKGQFIRELDQACRTAGFFYIANHGVDHELIAQTFEQSARFFELSAERKMAMHLSLSKCRRGYERIGDQTLDENALPDQKESYYCGIDYPPDHPYVVKGYDTYGTSQWPNELTSFQATMSHYIQAQLKLCNQLMSLIAQALNEPAEYFEPTLNDPMVTLRLLRYPPHPPLADAKLFGAGAHTDWGALTTLAQDEQGGLQIQMPNGQWVGAPPIADTFVVNLGDMMPRWTNDIYRSNPHRVINASSSDKPRFSIPFFFEPNYEAPIEAIASTVSKERPKRYGPCTAGEHLRAMVEKTYGGKVHAG